MKKSLLKENFIEKARKIHGDKFDYSKVEYVNNKTKVTIICPIHGEFEQLPLNHLQGTTCPRCAKEESFLTTEEFITKSKLIHGDKYDYSQVNYVNARTKVLIICPIHGEFWQAPHQHLIIKSGCPRCGELQRRKKLTKTLDVFIKQACDIHHGYYNYSKTDYKGSLQKIEVICPTHGSFWITPSAHLQGQGCPKCKASKLEKEVSRLLIDSNIEYIYQDYPSFLQNGLSHMSLDFYLPEYKLAIECQGEQHYTSIPIFGGDETLQKTIERDARKLKLCEENDITILYFAKDKYADNIITDKKLLLEKIKSYAS